MRWYLGASAAEGGAAGDDSPLYVFEGAFGRDKGKDRGSRRALRGVRDTYDVPRLFPSDVEAGSGKGGDLLGLCGARARPPHRWIVHGPALSGACLHRDPLSTHAWNALLAGRKRWALYPPGVPRRDILTDLLDDRARPDEREASSWFADAFPRTTELGWRHAGPIHGVQGPGDVIFVPCGWWHAVLNLDTTTAITQNYVSEDNFAAAWPWVRRGRPKLSARWLGALDRFRPDLAAIARAVDASGRFLDGEGRPVPDASSSSSSESSASESEEDDA